MARGAVPTAAALSRAGTERTPVLQADRSVARTQNTSPVTGLRGVGKTHWGASNRDCGPSRTPTPPPWLRRWGNREAGGSPRVQAPPGLSCTAGERAEETARGHPSHRVVLSQRRWSGQLRAESQTRTGIAAHCRMITKQDDHRKKDLLRHQATSLLPEHVAFGEVLHLGVPKPT